MERDDQRRDERGRNLRDLFEEENRDTDADSAEELRYEGPITIEPDDEEYEHQERSGAGRAFITAALIFGVVVIIVAGAMLLRGGGGSLPELAESDRTDAEAPGESELATADRPGGVDYREIPDVEPDRRPLAGLDLPERPAEATPEAVDERAAGKSAPSTGEPSPPATPPAVSRPEPRPAAVVEQRPEAAEARPTPSNEGVTPRDVRRLATGGRVHEAARAGLRLARNRSGRWTLQVLLACDPVNVTKAFRDVGGDELLVVPRPYEGRSCFALCWGDFGSRADAEASRPLVPSHFGTGRFLARRFEDVAGP